MIMTPRYAQLMVWVPPFLSAIFLVYLVYQAAAAYKKRPPFAKSDIVYQEWTASGNSEANILTKLGGANNCLRLIVTSDYLIITSWFPFVLFAAFYDLEHSIPLQAITSVEKKRGLFFSSGLLTLTYRDADGKSRRVSLKPRNTKSFIRAIRQ